MALPSSPMRLASWGLPPSEGDGPGSSQLTPATPDAHRTPFAASTPSRSPGFFGASGRVSADALRQWARAAAPESPHQPDGGEPEQDPAAAQRFIWGTTINIQDSIAVFKDFLVSFCLMHRKKLHAARSLGIDIDDVLESDFELADGDLEPYYPQYLQRMKQAMAWAMNLDCSHLLAYAPSRKLYDQLVKYPTEIISIMDFVVTDLFLEVACTPQEREAAGTSISLSVRPYNLQQSLNLRTLNPGDIDQLVTIKGLLIRSTPVIPDPKVGFFRCLVCNETLEVEVDRGRIEEPTRCPNAQCTALNTMQLVHNRCTFASKQLAKLQETPDMIPDGQTPYTVSLNVYDDLVDTVKPGDRVQVTGIYRSMPVRINTRQRSIKPVFRTFIDVVHFRTVDPQRIARDESAVETNEYIVPAPGGGIDDDDDEFGVNAGGSNSVKISAAEEADILAMSQRNDIYEYLARSLAPSIYEMDDAKKGVLLQLFGGHHKYCGTARYRGDINVLLVGDPGVAKSQLLQYVHKITPRGIYTSGKGSSAVGLTASVVRDPDTNAFVLESGALVLSDGGVCCIDEFDKMSDSTRAILHEVMEQQTISIAKAGIITTLNARTSILASANPIKSKFDLNLSLVENINLPPSLLSRFDLLFVILDVPDEAYDRRLAQHLVSLYMDDRPETAATNGMDVCPAPLLTKYISYARSRIQPELDDEAAQELVQAYVEMRQLGGGSIPDQPRTGKTVTATTRQLESMVRLAEAHAKMRLSHTVTRDDVCEAARLLREAIKQGATDPRTGRIDMDLLTSGNSRTRIAELALLKTAVSDYLATLDDTHGRVPLAGLVNEIKRRSAHGVTLTKDQVEEAVAELASEGMCSYDRRSGIVRRVGSGMPGGRSATRPTRVAASPAAVPADGNHAMDEDPELR